MRSPLSRYIKRVDRAALTEAENVGAILRYDAPVAPLILPWVLGGPVLAFAPLSRVSFAIVFGLTMLVSVGCWSGFAWFYYRRVKRYRARPHAGDIVDKSSELFTGRRQLQLPLAQRAALAALMLVGSGFYVYGRTHTPPLASINGAYHSSCCPPIVIQDGSLRYGRSNAAVDLEDMKFGLTGYVDGQFTRSGIERSRDQTAIDFSELRTRHVIYLPVDGRGTSFALGVR